jgi:small-conductance mechanosensitive channel
MAMRTTCRLVIAACLLASVAGAQGGPGPEAELHHVTAPVVLDGDTLFRVRGTTSYPAADRAQRISDRVRQAAANGAVAPESVEAVPDEGTVNVKAGGALLMVVTDADAQLEEVDRQILARAFVDRIQRAIVAYRAARQPQALLRGVRRAGLATIVFLGALLFLRWATRKLEDRYTRRYAERIEDVRFQSFEILRAQRIRDVAHGLTVAARTGAAAVVVYAWVQYVLSCFPATRPAADRLLALVVEPMSRLGSGLVAWLPSLLFLVIVYVLARWLLGLSRLFFDAVGEGRVAISRFEPSWAAPTYGLLRLAILAVALVIAYPSIPGSNSAAFQGMSILFGLMLSIGSSSVIANVVAGYSMIYRRAFQVGDRIGVDGVMGDVTEVRLQVTHLRTPKNEEVVIPNSTLLGNNVVNYSSLARVHGLILHTTVGIGYETPWRQVEAMLLLAASRTPGLGKEPAPFVLQKSLGDFAVVYELNVPCDTPQLMGPLYSRLHQSILDVFNEYGVQIMTPAYEGDPAEPKLVAKEQWWTSPASPASANGGEAAGPLTGKASA